MISHRSVLAAAVVVAAVLTSSAVLAREGAAKTGHTMLTPDAISVGAVSSWRAEHADRRRVR
jgi:hypothetical protein